MSTAIETEQIELIIWDSVGWTGPLIKQICICGGAQQVKFRKLYIQTGRGVRKTLLCCHTTHSTLEWWVLAGSCTFSLPSENLPWEDQPPHPSLLDKRLCRIADEAIYRFIKKYMFYLREKCIDCCTFFRRLISNFHFYFIRTFHFPAFLSLCYIHCYTLLYSNA